MKPTFLIYGLVTLVACSDTTPTHQATSLDRPRDPITATADANVADVGDAAEDSGDSGPSDVLVDAPDILDDTRDDVLADGVDDVAVDVDTVPTIDIHHPDPSRAPLSSEALAAIDTSMKSALAVPALNGRSFGGVVVDVDNDQVVWALDADRLLIPASNTKVFTTAAAFDLLGDDHRMLTRVFASGAIAADGTLAGDLDLHGEHDFTWSHWFYKNPREPADRIADALWSAGLRKVSGQVGIWGAYLYDGYHYGSYDAATQRTRAGQAFVAALNARGITVSGARVDHATMDLPPGQELTRWESIPLWVGAWAINRKSHNEMADVLCRHLGWLEGGSSDYLTGASVVAAWLATTGVDATGFTVSDGSGLALENRVSARQLAGVYGYMTKSPHFPAWISSLSVGGGGGPASTDDNEVAIVTENISPYMGTLAGRMTGTNTAGRVFGKSGTNAGITTSGLLYNRYDGHRYAFAFLMNTLPSGTADTARVTQDALVAVVAKQLVGRGARPEAPTLGCARVRPDGLAEVDLTPAEALPSDDPKAGYALETSPDGKLFRPEDTLFVTAPPFVFNPPTGTLFVRARAETSTGFSDPSDIYALRAGGSRVLLVDADDRWQRQPTNENPMGAAHGFMVAYAAAMPDGLAIDTCPNEAVTDGSVALAGYDAVAWATGEEATTDESIAAAEATALADYLAFGGALFVSGAEIAWDLDPAGNVSATTADRTFYRTWLGASYAGDDAGVFVAEGTPGGLFADRTHNQRIGFWTPGQIFVAYPDELLPMEPAVACLAYLGPGSVGCVQSSGDVALVNLGFPFESIDGAAERALVMRRVMDHFGL